MKKRKERVFKSFEELSKLKEPTLMERMVLAMDDLDKARLKLNSHVHNLKNRKLLK